MDAIRSGQDINNIRALRQLAYYSVLVAHNGGHV